MAITHLAHVRRFSLVTLAVVALSDCAKPPALQGIGGAAPNPSGCYVFVYDQTDWHGERAVLNGPGKWWNIEQLRLDEKDWRNRVRSIEVGPSATVTLYAELNYRGTSEQFGPSSKPPRFGEGLRKGVESIDVTCAERRQ